MQAFKDIAGAVRLEQLSPSCPGALKIPPHPGTCTAQPSIPSTKKGGSLSAQNQKVVNDIHIRHRKLD